jgi:hypothetical protein
MSETARRVPAMMDTAGFLAWDPPGNGRWQLIDGQPTAMARASETHNIIQVELGALIRCHLVAMAERNTLAEQPVRNVERVSVIPSVQEILVLHSTAVRAEMLRRDADGNWPERLEVLEDGMLEVQRTITSAPGRSPNVRAGRSSRRFS